MANARIHQVVVMPDVLRRFVKSLPVYDDAFVLVATVYVGVFTLRLA